MAGVHATTGRRSRGRGRHRAAREPRVAYGWLGAGAVTLGVGAALVGGAGVAHAEEAGSDATASSASSGPSNDTKTPDAKTPDAKSPDTKTPDTKTPDTKADDTATDPKDAEDPKDAGAPKGAPATEMKVEVRTVRGHSSTTPEPAGATTGGPTGTTPTAAVKAAAVVVDREPTPPTAAEARTATAPIAAAAPITTTADVQVPAAATTAVVVSPPPAVFPDLPPFPGNAIRDFVAQAASIVNTLLLPNPQALPNNPLHLLAIEVVRRVETTLGLPVIGTVLIPTPDPITGTLPVSSGTGTPSPTDTVTTPYGDIGKWLLQPNGQIATYGNQRLDGRTLLEPVNVVIVDPNATSAADATRRLNAALTAAGFPALPVHTAGFGGVIDGITYGQQPIGTIDAFSNNFFLLPDDHARAFGPDPVETAAGYVWTIAVSREQLGFNGLLLTHVYVSYNAARNELAQGLVESGATLVGAVPLSNAYDTATYTTGDNDGYALVLQLN